MPKFKEKTKELPSDIRQKVEDFVQFLMEKHMGKTRRPLKLDWRGAIEEMKNEYASVELQNYHYLQKS